MYDSAAGTGQSFWSGPDLQAAHARLMCSTDCNDMHGAQTAKHKAGEASQNGAASPAEVDLAADRHRGQFALRKLYHESERLVVVLYTSPGCGPCRTLKPIFSKVVDEYSGKVRPLRRPSRVYFLYHRPDSKPPLCQKMKPFGCFHHYILHAPGAFCRHRISWVK